MLSGLIFQATRSQALLSHYWTRVCLSVGFFARQITGFPGSLSSLASTFFFFFKKISVRACVRPCPRSQQACVGGRFFVCGGGSGVKCGGKKRSDVNALTLSGEGN